jgi:hypothetical protein
MRLLIFLLAVTFFTSCNNGTSNINQAISADSAQKVYMNILVAKPVFVSAFKDSLDRDFIIGIRPYSNPLTNYIITRIVSINNNWQTHREDTIGNELQVNILDSFRIEKIKNQNYILFTAKHYMPGRLTEGLASIEFHLIDLNDLHDYSLGYDGEEVEENVVSGEFGYDDLLKQNGELKKFQETRSQQSKYIYKKTAADYDINNVANFKKKWLIDNPNIETREYAYEEPIHLTSYGKGLIDEYIGKDLTDNGDVIFQNADYKIIVMWRHGVYAFDKKHRKQIPIWLYNCFTDWNIYAEFINKNVLSITNENCYTVTVDLDKRIYSRKQFDN